MHFTCVQDENFIRCIMAGRAKRRSLQVSFSWTPFSFTLCCERQMTGARAWHILHELMVSTTQWPPDRQEVLGCFISSHASVPIGHAFQKDVYRSANGSSNMLQHILAYQEPSQSLNVLVVKEYSFRLTTASQHSIMTAELLHPLLAFHSVPADNKGL